MKHKHAIVIDKNGYKTEFVLVHVQEVNGTEVQTVDTYLMQAGEHLVFEDVPTALAMLKPRWYRKKWMETATEAEIAAARPEPAPEPQAQPFAAETVVLTRLEAEVAALREQVAALLETKTTEKGEDHGV